MGVLPEAVPDQPSDDVQLVGQFFPLPFRSGGVKDRVPDKAESFDVSQILPGTVCWRGGEDVGESVLNYAEVKALAVGNPLIKQRVELTNKMDKLRVLQRDYLDARERKQRELAALPK